MSIILNIKILLGVLLIVSFAGCTDSKNLSVDTEELDLPKEAVEVKSQFPKLSSVLNELSQSEHPADFAESRDLHFADGKVRVIIELADPSAQIPERFKIVTEGHYSNLLQGMVSIEQLGELSNEPYINFIRAPLKPQPAQGGVQGKI